MTDYGAWIGATSIDQLEGVRPDPNPPVPCEVCDEGYKVKDYWEERCIKGYDWDPHEIAWVCDECIEQAKREYELEKRRRNHAQLTEWSE